LLQSDGFLDTISHKHSASRSGTAGLRDSGRDTVLSAESLERKCISSGKHRRIDGASQEHNHCFNIPASDNYNWDGMGHEYRATPRYTLATASETGAGGKEDKIRFTLLISVNGDGTENSVAAIGKSKSPRGISQTFFESLGIKYISNTKA
jgi:hypothetical protein